MLFATIHGGPILPSGPSEPVEHLQTPRVLRRGSAFSSHLLIGSLLSMVESRVLMVAEVLRAMTKRSPVSPAPGPLEDYAQCFDDLFGARAQRHSFRRYLE